MVAINIKKSMHNMDCVTLVCILDSQVFGLVKNFKDQYLHRLISVINVKTLHDGSIH